MKRLQHWSECGLDLLQTRFDFPIGRILRACGLEFGSHRTQPACAEERGFRLEIMSHACRRDTIIGRRLKLRAEVAAAVGKHRQQTAVERTTRFNAAFPQGGYVEGARCSTRCAG